MTGCTDIWEHSGGERHIVVDWSPIIEDLYIPELGFMDICAVGVFPFCFSCLGFRMHPHHSLHTLVDY